MTLQQFAKAALREANRSSFSFPPPTKYVEPEKKKRIYPPTPKKNYPPKTCGICSTSFRPLRLNCQTCPDPYCRKTYASFCNLRAKRANDRRPLLTLETYLKESHGKRIMSDKPRTQNPESKSHV